jgi:hypothetical protein
VQKGLNFKTVSVNVEGIIESSMIAGSYRGAALIGGSVKEDSRKAAEDRKNNGSAADRAKSMDKLYKEELEKRTKGNTTQAEDEADAKAAADLRYMDAEDAVLSRAEDNAQRAARGEGLDRRSVKDEFKTYEKILEEELAVRAKEKGPYLRLSAFSEAEERINNVEISLVLDISGSMGSGDKMANMRDAAYTFVDAVINDATEDLVSVSVIPYSEHVSAGEDIINEFWVDRTHNYSHCIEFEQDDFNTTTMGLNNWGNPKRYDQVQHFYWGNTSWNQRTNPVCPDGDYEDIIAFSQDTDELKDQIGRLVPRGSTSIFAGMKWAAGMLDPSFRPINDRLSRRGKSDTEFSNRPVDFTDPETLKTVILMTDGQNHFSKRINPQVYANSSHYSHWNNNNFDWWVNRNVNWNQRGAWSTDKYWPDYGDTLLSSVCSAAKDKNIVIWSVGFEVTDHGANVMRDCASSPSHFFRVEGVEIKEAFSAIARQINQLRLTQ